MGTPFAMAVLGCLVALAPATQEKPAPAPPDTRVQVKAAAEAVARAAQPGEPHKFLASLAGTWTVESRAWTGPGEPTVSKCTATCTMILGGRYLLEEIRADLGGMPFEGKGITGFDNTAKQFQAVWVDTTGTGLAVATGSLDPSGKVLTSTMSFTDPRTGKGGSVKAVLKILDEKTHTFEVFECGPDGSEVKTMEMTYKKV